jgi:hypothetical protein
VLVLALALALSLALSVIAEDVPMVSLSSATSSAPSLSAQPTSARPRTMLVIVPVARAL